MSLCSKHSYAYFIFHLFRLPLLQGAQGDVQNSSSPSDLLTMPLVVLEAVSGGMRGTLRPLLPGSETSNTVRQAEVGDLAWQAELQCVLFAHSKIPSHPPWASYQCLLQRIWPCNPEVTGNHVTAVTSLTSNKWAMWSGMVRVKCWAMLIWRCLFPVIKIGS